MVTEQIPLIAHVVYSFRVGGLENGVVNLINRLPHERYRHVVIALTDCCPQFCERITRTDVDFISLHKPPGHGVKVYPELYRLFRRLRPRIVHTRNLAALEAVVPAWAAGVKYRIHGEHGWDSFDREGRSRKYRLVRRLYAPLVNHYVALSGQIESYLREHVGVSSQKLSRICNGVDATRFHPALLGREMLAGGPFNDSRLLVFGTVGRLQAVKDQLTLVRAFALACQQGGEKGRGWRLLIAGDGPLRAEVEAEILAHGLTESVWLAGERRDVPAGMRALDVFILPSRSEGISNTILEAMASALPVIATKVGGNGELVGHEHSGLLVEAADPQGMAVGLLRYAADVSLRRGHGAAGRARVEEEFSLDGMVARYQGMYERISLR